MVWPAISSPSSSGWRFPRPVALRRWISGCEVCQSTHPLAPGPVARGWRACRRSGRHHTEYLPRCSWGGFTRHGGARGGWRRRGTVWRERCGGMEGVSERAKNPWGVAVFKTFHDFGKVKVICLLFVYKLRFVIIDQLIGVCDQGDKPKHVICQIGNKLRKCGSFEKVREKKYTLLIYAVLSRGNIYREFTHFWV